MKTFKNARGAAIAVAMLLLLTALTLWLKPPEIIRIGANYSAKIVCSNVFIVGRDPGEVLSVDVQAPGNPLLRFVRVSVDRERGVVRAGLLGFIGDGLAVSRPGAGCAAVPDGKLDLAALAKPDRAPAQPVPSDEPWPDGNGVKTDASIDRLIAVENLAGAGMRAVVVVHRGRILAERYGNGFNAQTPLLGWSMTKSVVAGLIGVLVKDGRIRLDQPAGWDELPGDGRAHIKIEDLLAMSSGLRFNETYGAVSDVTRMLYLEPDMAGFARAQPLEHRIGQFWSYSSGTAVILSRIFQDAAGPATYALMHQRLFDPLGMRSAIIETDEHGTLVGSSYMYASARDWARYGQFLLQQGVWRGHDILPRGYVAMMADPVAASGGQYGHGQVWRWGSDAATPGENPDTAFGIPGDTFWMEGHDGQYVAIIPSRELVVVRMGLTPAREHYRPQPLVHALLDAVK